MSLYVFTQCFKEEMILIRQNLMLLSQNGYQINISSHTALSKAICSAINSGNYWWPEVRILNLQVRNKQTEEAQINKWLLTKTCIIKLLQDKAGKNKQYINNIIYYSKLSYTDDENLAKGKML